MVPNNQSGRRIRRPVKSTRKVVSGAAALTPAKRQAILNVMYQYRRHGPKNVHAELRRTRHDITLAMVHAVFRQAGLGVSIPSEASGR